MHSEAMESEAERDPYKLVGGSLKQYRILSLAEIGERGIVYQAKHEVTGVVVAIKVLRSDLTFGEFGDQEGLSYFFRSVSKIIQLNHSSLIQTYEVDLTDDGLVYVVMEWAEGRTLRQELEERGVFSLELATLMSERICDAVGHAHANGVVHRELNAGDILLIPQEGRETLVRIRNFGMAKALSRLISASSMVAGRPCEISSDDSAATRQIDQAADLHGVGCLLYQMLSGHTPGDNDGRLRPEPEIRWAPKPLRTYSPDLPEAVETVILRAISDKAGYRFQTAGELANAIRQTVNSVSGEIVLQCVDAQNGAIVSGAKVFLNGRPCGQIDAEGLWRQKNLSERTYLVEVELDRYVRWHRSTTLKTGNQAKLLAELERERKGGLYIYCGVAKTTVEIDGAVVGQTDDAGRLTIDSIAAGSHTVRLSHRGYASIEKQIDVMAWEQTALDLPLEERSSRKSSEETLKIIKSAFDPLRAEMGKMLPKKSPNGVAPTETPDPEKSSEAQDRTPAVSPKVRGPAGQTCSVCSTLIPTHTLFCPKCGTVRNGGRPLTAVGSGTKKPDSPRKESAPKPIILPAIPEFEEINALTPTQQKQGMQEMIELTGLLRPASTATRGSAGNQDRILFLFVGGVILIAVLFMAIMVQRAYVKSPSYALELTTLPPNTRVVLNGKLERATDSEGRVSFEGLDKGPHTIKLSREGYRELERTVTLPLTGANSQISLERIIPDEMVYIPGGTLTMGGGPATRENASGPAHPQALSPYFLDKYETSREKYKKFLEATGRTAPPNWTGVVYPEGTAQWPVTGVSWNDASAYCQWAGGRLPTEEEWEFAARGDDGRLYPWGAAFADDKANIGREAGQILPVGSFPTGVSPYGVFDLAGNVWEWTDNDFAPYPGSPYQLVGCKRCKTLRGGAYINQPEYATTIFRQPYEASLIAPPNEYYGFRCARSAILP
jgi:formylglycine-generating enzyme required for sulfatase activity/serine/threonine protein kinase